MAYRIYIDESGTHGDSEWLLIGMLFVPQHGALHNAPCTAKDEVGYYHTGIRNKAKYREFHFAEARSARDVALGKAWIDIFCNSTAHFRVLAFEWSTWNGKYFGDPFEPDTLKKRRAYKKWCELLLQPEISSPLDGGRLRGTEVFLDPLRIAYGYDVVDHLRERFSPGAVTKIQHTQSWHDANQCLQLTDLLLGGIKQAFSPSSGLAKLELSSYLAEALAPFGVERLVPGFWKQYHHTTLRQKHPRFSAWCWLPERKRN